MHKIISTINIDAQSSTSILRNFFPELRTVKRIKEAVHISGSTPPCNDDCSDVGCTRSFTKVNLDFEL